MSRWSAAPLDDAPVLACCYALFLNAKLVYIGQTTDLRNRLATHKIQRTSWWPALSLKYRKLEHWQLLRLERRLLRRLRPLWNINGTAIVDVAAIAIVDAAKNPAAVALGRKGGKAKSNAKAEAVRANGKLGGRPRTRERVTEQPTEP